MGQQKLNYSAINIAQAEKELDNSFFGAMNRLGREPRFGDIVFLLRAGGATPKEVDSLVKKGIPVVMEMLIEGISEAGFLGKKVDMAPIRKAMRALMGEAAAPSSPTTSGSSGKN